MAGWLLHFTNYCTAQNVFDVTEITAGGKEYVNQRNSDISSTLRINVNREKLIAAISEKVNSNPLPPDAMKLLSILSSALEKKNEMLDRFKSTVDGYKPADGSEEEQKRAEAFNRTMEQNAKEILNLFAVDSKLQLYYALDEAPGLISPLYPALEKRIKEIENEILDSATNAETRIQFGGWLLHNNNEAALHFSNFDTHALGGFYELERWRILPTKDQLEEFEKFDKLAKQSKFKEADFTVALKEFYLNQFIAAAQKAISENSRSFEAEAKAVLSSVDAPTIKTTITSILQATSRLHQHLQERIQYYSTLKKKQSFSLPSLLEGITKDIATFDTFKKSLQDSTQKLITEINNAATAVKAACTALKSKSNEYLKELAGTILSSSGLNALTVTNHLPKLALEFGKEVISHSLQSLPKNSSTDLRYAGIRQAGDRVVLKMVVKKGPSETILEYAPEITLYRIQPHFEGTVGVTMAHPLSQTAITRDVQMAPYYNLLFKGVLGMSGGWKRRSELPNTILDFNFGIHVSTPDFDKDDVPELGVGLVLSGFYDYFQAGWAYNFFHGTSYLHFGIRLPVPSMNFGGGSKSATITETP